MPATKTIIRPQARSAGIPKGYCCKYEIRSFRHAASLKKWTTPALCLHVCCIISILTVSSPYIPAHLSLMNIFGNPKRQPRKTKWQLLMTAAQEKYSQRTSRKVPWTSTFAVCERKPRKRTHMITTKEKHLVCLMFETPKIRIRQKNIPRRLYFEY